MFVKPFKSKPNTSLKNSDKKKLRTRLANQCQKFNSPITNPEDVGLKSEKSVQLFSQKIHTAQNEQVTCIYEDSEPLILENRGGTLIPTVYLIWKQPGLINSSKIFTIW